MTVVKIKKQKTQKCVLYKKLKFVNYKIFKIERHNFFTVEINKIVSSSNGDEIM